MATILLNSDLKKLVHISAITTDNQVFRLHYKFSSVMFIAFSLAVSGYQFFGNPMLCMNNDDIGNTDGGKAARILNQYCWVEGTFTLPKYLTMKVGEEVPHPGVHKYVEGDEVIEHAYYQWVCFVLFFLGCLFCVPKLLWKSWEGSKIKSLVGELAKGALDEGYENTQEEKVVSYFHSHQGNHTGYAFRFLLCETLNFFNVIFQICLLDRFLGGQFLTYGPRVFEFVRNGGDEAEDPMMRVFPRVTKCTFHRYGPAGSVQKHDVMCALPLNILNEKIFAAIWVWLVLLAILSGLAILYRLVVFASWRARFLLTKTYNILTPEHVVENVLFRLSFGDWFVLYQISYNVDAAHFKQLMLKLNKALNFDSDSDYSGGTKSSDML